MNGPKDGKKGGNFGSERGIVRMFLSFYAEIADTPSMLPSLDCRHLKSLSIRQYGLGIGGKQAN